MIDHLSLGVRDLARSIAFYRDVLGTLGWGVQRERDDEVAFGTPDAWSLFLYPVDGTAAVAAPRMHVAFAARDRAAVRAFHARALASGGSAVPDRDPDERPQFGADYYGAVLKDPDGHALEVLTRNGEGAAT